MNDEKVLLALGEVENALIKKILLQYEFEIIEINNRSKLLSTAQKEKPLTIYFVMALMVIALTLAVVVFQ